jgi:hypothetical protein
MSANPLHPIFQELTKSLREQIKPMSEPDPMAPLKKVYADALEAIKVEQAVKRRNVQRMIESQIVEQRPDFIDAHEIVDALQAGLEARLESDNYDLPLEVRDAFNDLRKALDAACPYEPDAYDSMGIDPRDQYNGPEDEERE